WTTRHLGAHDLTMGASLRYAHSAAPFIFPTFDQLVASAYVQDEWRAGEHTRLTLGARYDLNSEVDQRVMPRGGILVHLGPAVDLRASTGFSFRNPAMFDLHLQRGGVPLIVQTPSGPVVIPPGTPAGALFPGSPANGLQRDVGNPNLNPETMVSGDAGVRARLGPLELDSDAFVESLSDGIRKTGLGRINAIDIDIVGTETIVWLTLGRRAQLQASYTYQEPVSTNPPEVGTGTPTHLASGAVGVHVGP